MRRVVSWSLLSFKSKNCQCCYTNSEFSNRGDTGCQNELCDFFYTFTVDLNVPSFLDSIRVMYSVKKSAAFELLWLASFSSKVSFPLNSSPSIVRSFSSGKMISRRQGHLARAVCRPTSSIPNEGKQKALLRSLVAYCQ